MSGQAPKLASAREAAKLGTHELAAKAHVDEDTITSIERAQANGYVWSLDTDRAARLADALGSTPSALFGSQRLTPPPPDQRGVVCHRCYIVISLVHYTVCRPCSGA